MTKIKCANCGNTKFRKVTLLYPDLFELEDVGDNRVRIHKVQPERTLFYCSKCAKQLDIGTKYEVQ